MALTLSDVQARLLKVRAAIDAALEGGGVSSFGIRDRSVQYDLRWLRDEETRLMALERQLSGGGVYVAWPRSVDE